MTLAIVGVIANLWGVFYVISKLSYYGDSASSWAFIIITVAFWLISVLGLVLMGSSQSKKTGMILTIVGSILFVPLGLIAMIGARKAAQPSNDNDLESRRRLAASKTAPANTNQNQG